MNTTTVPESSALLPYLGAFNGSAAYWILRATDHLDQPHESERTFDAGDALYAALELETFDGIDKCYALSWGIEVGIAIAAVIRADPFADHTEAVAVIIDHYRGLVDTVRAHIAEEDANECKRRVAAGEAERYVGEHPFDLLVTKNPGMRIDEACLTIRAMIEHRDERPVRALQK
jgi:hypothetical protein